MAKSGRWMVTATRHPPKALIIRYRLSLLRIRPRGECLHSLAINGWPVRRCRIGYEACGKRGAD
jgi:hypothetical protein